MAQRKGAKWVAIARLGGSDDRMCAQLGKRTVFFTGDLSIADLLALLAPGAARGGDET